MIKNILHNTHASIDSWRHIRNVKENINDKEILHITHVSIDSWRHVRNVKEKGNDKKYIT